MTIGDLKRCIEGWPDSTDIVVSYEDKALHVGGLGRATLGSPAAFQDTSLVLTKGVEVFEITARDHA